MFGCIQYRVVNMVPHASVLVFSLLGSMHVGLDIHEVYGSLCALSRIIIVLWNRGWLAFFSSGISILEDGWVITLAINQLSCIHFL